jgi:hypothetical protein
MPVKTYGKSIFARLAFATAVLALGACASAPAATSPPVYTERGPHQVGVTTLSLGPVGGSDNGNLRSGY